MPPERWAVPISTRQPASAARICLPLVMVLCAGFGLKGMIYQSVGAKAYAQRVQALQVGEGFDRLGGWLMQADPVTVFVGGQNHRYLAALK